MDATASYVDQVTILTDGSVKLQWTSGAQDVIPPIKVTDTRASTSFFAGVAAWASANPVKVAALVGALAGSVPDKVISLLKVLLA